MRLHLGQALLEHGNMYSKEENCSADKGNTMGEPRELYSGYMIGEGVTPAQQS
jgi:hypothetical protein